MELAQPLPLLRQLCEEHSLEAVRLVVVDHGLGLFVGQHFLRALPSLKVYGDHLSFLIVIGAIPRALK